MAKVSEVYMDKYLKAADLGEGPQEFEIVGVEVSELKASSGGKDFKIILLLKGLKKGFVCNKTNSQQLAALIGDDTDRWVGCCISIMSMPVSFGGRMVAGIRIVSAKRIPQAKAVK